MGIDENRGFRVEYDRCIEYDTRWMGVLTLTLKATYDPTYDHNGTETVPVDIRVGRSPHHVEGEVNVTPLVSRIKYEWIE